MPEPEGGLEVRSVVVVVDGLGVPYDPAGLLVERRLRYHRRLGCFLSTIKDHASYNDGMAGISEALAKNLKTFCES